MKDEGAGFSLQARGARKGVHFWDPVGDVFTKNGSYLACLRD